MNEFRVTCDGCGRGWLIFTAAEPRELAERFWTTGQGCPFCGGVELTALQVKALNEILMTFTIG